MNRTMAQYFKKPSWEENRGQIASLMKTLFNFLVQSYFQMVPFYYRKSKPSFLVTHLASDPVFPQKPVPVGSLLFPLSRNWQCRLSQQVMKSSLSSPASFQQPTDGIFCKWTIKIGKFLPQRVPFWSLHGPNRVTSLPPSMTPI